jgi:hypothetical protein
MTTTFSITDTGSTASKTGANKRELGSRLRRLALLALMAVGGFGAVACTSVQAWERGRLAKAHMALEPDPTQRGFRSHVYGSREAAIGGEAGSGGGCGCY